MSRLYFIIVTILLMVVSSVFAADVQKRPNFIFFITDDISAEDLGCYGNDAIKTPNLDRIVKQGLLFHNAYLSISSCSPSRCSIITGRYPHNTGAPELHTPLPAEQVVFPELLKNAGYYTALSGKHHMGNAVNRGFNKISKGKGPGKEGDWVQMLKDRPKDKPFFFWFASSDAHRNWTINDKAPKYDPKNVNVPPYLVNGPLTQQDLANYYHEVSRTDHYAGDLIKELKRQGIDNNTYFIYCSDNGRPFPRGKTYLYDSGIKTPLIIWCPGNVTPGVTDSLVSSIDFAATFLDLAGLSKAPTIQGVSLKPILKNHKAKVRDYVFAEHNWHVYQNHERMIRHDDWVYIRNAWPTRHNLCVESDPTFPAGKELWEAHKKGELNAQQTFCINKTQPKEQLYNINTDPQQLKNLAGDPAHLIKMKQMSDVLDRWENQTGDSVPIDPTNDRYLTPYHGSKKKNINPNHRRGEFPGASRNAAKINHPGPIRTMN